MSTVDKIIVKKFKSKNEIVLKELNEIYSKIFEDLEQIHNDYQSISTKRTELIRARNAITSESGEKCEIFALVLKDSNCLDLRQELIENLIVRLLALQRIYPIVILFIFYFSESPEICRKGKNFFVGSCKRQIESNYR